MKKGRLYRLAGLGMILVLVAFAAACGSSGRTDTLPSGKNENQKQEAETEDGTIDSLNVGVSSLWATLSPFQTGQNQFGAFVRTIYDRMICIVDGEYIPQVAASWQVADDGVTWTVQMHDNVYDSDGNSITSEDIVWFIEESKARAMRPQFQKVASVSAIDKTTFEVVMTEDIVDAFELVMCNVYAVSRKAFEESGDEFAATVVSSGPYEVVEFVSGSHLKLKKKADYWNKECEEAAFQNHVNNLTYTIITETSQQQIALESGTVDAFEILGVSLAEEFKNRTDFVIETMPGPIGTGLYFSGSESRPVAVDENLRKAIAWAIDTESLLVTAYGGMAEPMHDIAASSVNGYLEEWDEEQYFGYDPEKAKEYLGQSSYQGEPLVLMASNGSQYQKIAQVIQGCLRQVGINCELSLLDTALFAATQADGAQYDMILVSAGGFSITNLWGTRFDMNGYVNGDATSRKDAVLTDMIYETWTQKGFTKEHIDSVHQYIEDHCYAYGLALATVPSVYRSDLGITDLRYAPTGCIDYAASVY